MHSGHAGAIYGHQNHQDKMGLAGSLDLYVLLVDYVVGGIFFSIMLWAVILLITGIMGRMSMNSVLVVLITFLSVATVGYVGALAAVPILLWASWYLAVGLINYINNMR